MSFAASFCVPTCSFCFHHESRREANKYATHTRHFEASPKRRFVQMCFVSALVFCLLLLPVSSQGTAKCYFFGPRITIPGADYRRDFGLSQNQCAHVCKNDACCMAFEWHKEMAMCTLKSRSLNGTVTSVDDDVYFGLCLDYADSDRDRMWDHEIGGRLAASAPNVEREKCAEVCKKSLADNVESEKQQQSSPIKRSPFRILRARRNERIKESVAIYSWHSENPMDMDSQIGRCDCISVLHSVKLSFGSFSGFQI